MKKQFPITPRKVISSKYLPTRPSIPLTLTYLMALEVWNAPDLVKGITYTLLVLLWIKVIYLKITEKECDVVFENESTNQNQD